MRKVVFSYRLCFSFSLSLSSFLEFTRLICYVSNFIMIKLSNLTQNRFYHWFYHVLPHFHIYVHLHTGFAASCLLLQPQRQIFSGSDPWKSRRGRSGADCDVPCTNAPQPEAPGPHNLRAVTPEKCSLAAMGSSYFPERKTCPHEPEKPSSNPLGWTHTHTHYIYIIYIYI